MEKKERNAQSLKEKPHIAIVLISKLDTSKLLLDVDDWLAQEDNQHDILVES